MQYLIRKITLCTPDSDWHLQQKDILIDQGVISKIADQIKAPGAKIIEGQGKMISVGFIDLFADFACPGYEQHETISQGIRAALRGGYTDVCLLPNVHPITQNHATVAHLSNQSSSCRIHPLGAVTKHTEGNELSEMYDMYEAGAVAFTDGRKSIQHAGILLKALQYIKTFNGVIIDIPEDLSISKNGLMHEDELSTQLGMPGKPAIAEHIAIQRNLELLRYTNSALHITGISTKKSVALIKEAKKQGLQVTCSVTPYHLLFTDHALMNYDSVFKVNPPLRNETDRKALIKGIEDGTIDCIVSHHTPLNWDAKNVEFEYAKPGMISLQTMLPMLIQAAPHIAIEHWIKMLTITPRKILKLPQPQIAENEKARCIIFDPSASWTYTLANNESKSANSPLLNQNLIGKIEAVFIDEHLYTWHDEHTSN